MTDVLDDGGAAKVPTILVFGLRPERLIGSEGRIDAFLEPPGRDELPVVMDALQSGIEAGGAVIAIVPDWFDAAALARLRTARALLEADRVAVHVTPLPPLAATALASLASAAARHLPSPGTVASLLGRLEAELHVLTWLGSVSGLSTPAPTLAQHLASLVPGSAFAVSSYPAPAVHRIGDGEIPLAPLRRASAAAVAAAPGGDAGWVRSRLAEGLGEIPVASVAPTPGGKAWWGTGRLAEAVVYPLDVAGLCAQLSASLEPWGCRWCGELIAAVPCPMCGHRGRPPMRRAA